MSKLVDSITMTVDGLTSVGEWYVTEGEHDVHAVLSSTMRRV